MVLNFSRMTLRGLLFGVAFLMLFLSTNAFAVTMGIFPNSTDAIDACQAYVTAEGTGSGCTSVIAWAPPEFEASASVISYRNLGADPVKYTTSCLWGPCNTLVWVILDGGCPVDTSLDQFGNCVADSNCVAGTVSNVTVPIFVEGGSNGQINISGIPPSFDVDGCTYDATTLVSCGLNACTYSATSTGETTTTGDLTTGATVDYNPPSNNNITNNETTDYAPYDVVNNPDGSTTTTETETTTTNTGAGTTVENNPDGSTITESDGSTTTTETETTTTSNPDGSSTTTTTTTTTNSGGGATTTFIPEDPFQQTGQTDIPAENSEGTTTETTTTDPDGNITDTTDNCTGSSCPPVEEEPAEEEPFEPTFHDGVGSFDDAAIQVASDIDIAKEELSTVFNGVKDEIGALFSFDHNSAGSLPCPPPVAVEGFGEFDICMTEYEQQLSIVAQVLFFVASFLAIAIILR